MSTKISTKTVTKTLALALVIGTSAVGKAATPPTTLYHCEYHIYNGQDGSSYDMNGDIDGAEAMQTNGGSTYLSLEPLVTSGIDVTARVLISYWTDNGTYFYNPMTLHPRGDTATTLGAALLTGTEQQLIYEDRAKNTSYTFSCKAKQ